jgi:carbonic anhydrase
MENTMTTLETLIERNHDFAEQQFTSGLPIMPTLRTLVISCADPRVDLAHVLGLEPGEALVLRNIGGRITPSTLQAMGMLQAIAQVEGMLPPRGSFNLMVLHHTDCGITRLESKPELLADYFGIDPAEVSAKAVSDPHAAVAIDVATLKALNVLPKGWLISGLVYDVATGTVEVVVPPDAVDSAASGD